MPGMAPMGVAPPSLRGTSGTKPAAPTGWLGRPGIAGCSVASRLAGGCESRRCAALLSSDPPAASSSA